MVRCESRPSTIGPITLGTKQTGAPSAGNPHAGCDVAGAGNGFTVWLLRHSQRKRGATARPDLRNTAPVLDPTGLCGKVSRVDHMVPGESRTIQKLLFLLIGARLTSRWPAIRKLSGTARRPALA